MSRELVITLLGCGATGALGLALRPLAFAMRARQLELRDSPFSSAGGAPIAASFAPSIDLAIRGEERLALLLARAIREADRGRRTRAKTAPLALVVAPPPIAPGIGPDRRLLTLVEEALGCPLAHGSRVIRAGHAGTALALRDARALLREGSDEVVVAAASTPIDAPRLAALDARGRLWGEGRRGRIPGEAAAALRLGLRAPSPVRARLAEVEHEPEGGLDPGATGRMLRRARGTLQSGSFDLVVVDLNGEPDRSTAWETDVDAAGSALSDAEVAAWPDLTGDLGPATGALFAAVAVELAATGAERRGNVAFTLRGDDGAIGSFALELPSPSGDFVASSDTAVARRVPSRRLSSSEGDRTHASRIARGLFEDLAAMGLLLAPGPAGPDRQASARRLLDSYDALCALAQPGRGEPSPIDLRAATEAWVAEVDPPDRGRRFVGTFLRAQLAEPPARRSGATAKPRRGSQ